MRISQAMRLRAENAEALQDDNMRAEDPVLYTVLGCAVEALDRYIERTEEMRPRQRNVSWMRHAKGGEDAE